jgi:hypothetical protein
VELLNEPHYGPDFINHQPFEMTPSCVSTTVLYTLLSGQILKTADGNASVNVYVIFGGDTADDKTIRRLRSRLPELGNFYLILRRFLLCGGIKPNVISQGEKKRILPNDELEKE